jgi:hypothetical protein
MAEHPSAFGLLLVAYERAITPAIEVAIVGDAAATGPLRHEVLGRFIPASVSVTAEPGSESPNSESAASLTPLLASRTTATGRATAYLCEEYVCREPVTEPDALRAQIDAALEARRPPEEPSPG